MALKALACRRAMEIVATLGRIYGAPDLVPVTHVQIAGVSYKNLGDAGVEFLKEWAADGAKVRVPTTLNPAGMELDRWQEMGFRPRFRQTAAFSAIGAFMQHGRDRHHVVHALPLSPTSPLSAASIWPGPRAAPWSGPIRWSGPDTNREGGPSALAAAIVGRTARYGYHLDENRRATHVVEITCPVETIADFGALSYIVGKAVGDGVPYFPDLGAWLPPLPDDITARRRCRRSPENDGRRSGRLRGGRPLPHRRYTPEALDRGRSAASVPTPSV